MHLVGAGTVPSASRRSHTQLLFHLSLPQEGAKGERKGKGKVIMVLRLCLVQHNFQSKKRCFHLRDEGTEAKQRSVHSAEMCRCCAEEEGELLSPSLLHRVLTQAPSEGGQRAKGLGSHLRISLQLLGQKR